MLRQLFTVGCTYSGQVLSYTKIIGQLQDAGNTTTLAHYLELLNTAGMLTGLQKYAAQKVRQRASSPKFQALNNAFLSAQSDLSFAQARRDRARWGQLVESAVGAHLVNDGSAAGLKVFYWRERNREVDYVTKNGGAITALEVKSGRERVDRSGMEEFAEEFRPKRLLLIGTGGIPLSEFLAEPVLKWLE